MALKANNVMTYITKWNQYNPSSSFTEFSLSSITSSQELQESILIVCWDTKVIRDIPIH